MVASEITSFDYCSKYAERNSQVFEMICESAHEFNEANLSSPTLPCRWRSRARHAVIVVLPLPLAGADRNKAGQHASGSLLTMISTVYE